MFHFNKQIDKEIYPLIPSLSPWKQMCQNCMPPMNMNTLWPIYNLYESVNKLILLKQKISSYSIHTIMVKQNNQVQIKPFNPRNFSDFLSLSYIFLSPSSLLSEPISKKKIFNYSPSNIFLYNLFSKSEHKKNILIKN